jgi:hypothetical protein
VRARLEDPAAWTREHCAAYVAAVARWQLGDYVQRREPIGTTISEPSQGHGVTPLVKAVHRPGRPLSPQSRRSPKLSPS